MAGERGTQIENARRRVDQSSREFNISLWRIATGKYGPGGVTTELATVTGIPAGSISARVKECGRDYPPGPLVLGCYDTLDDCKYRDAIYHDSASPEARDFFGGISSSSRKRPGAEDARVGRERVTLADGTVKLISIAIDPNRN